MDFFFYFAFLIFIFTIQVSVLGFLAINGVVPDLSLIFAFFCGARFEMNRGVFMGGLTGFVQDCLSGGLLGMNTLSKSLIAFFVDSLKDKIFVEKFFPIAIFLASASLVDGAIFYIFSVMLMKQTVQKGFFFNSLPIYTIYNALVGPLVFFVLNLYQKRNRKEPDFYLPKTL